MKIKVLKKACSKFYVCIVLPGIIIISSCAAGNAVKSNISTDSADDTSVITASSCSQSDVQTAVNSASDNDMVIIPSGSCTWTSAVSISNKFITIQGAGQDQTILSNSSSSKNTLFRINIPNKRVRITQIGFSGTTPGSTTKGLIEIEGNGGKFRIDHCKFSNITGARTITIGFETGYGDNQSISGLIDHNKFINASTASQNIFVWGTRISWLEDDNLGMSGNGNAIYIEDNEFSQSGKNEAITDAENGARLVIRYNTIINGWIAWHDTGSTQSSRSTRSFEIYSNEFICTLPKCFWGAIGLRGGTGVVFNNTIPIGTNGYENPNSTQIYRAGAIGGIPWNNKCDSIVDRVCSNFRSYCNGGDKRICWRDSHCTDSGNGTTCMSSCFSDSDCPTGTTCLDKLDGHKDSYGWPCRDQLGTGKDDSVTYVQTSSPVYWWNNKTPNGKTLSLHVPSHNVNYIKINRDYFELSKPGYVPYIYPHPGQSIPSHKYSRPQD